MDCAGFPPAVEDNLCQKQLGLFQEFLRDIDLPLTLDRRDQPRDGSKFDISIATLSELEEISNIFLEATSKCPESLVFCVSASWFSRQPSSARQLEGLYRLYVHQGITIGKGGQTFLDKFTPPRQVTYLVNHLLTSPSKGRRAEGALVGGCQLETPCSSSTPLNHRVANTLFTTRICAAAGLRYPPTLGFTVTEAKESNSNNNNNYSIYQHQNGSGECHDPDIIEVKVEAGSKSTAHVYEAVERFLNSDAMKHYEQVMVKLWGQGVSREEAGPAADRHSKDDVEKVVSAVTALLHCTAGGSGVVLQGFVRTMEPLNTAQLGRHLLCTDQQQCSLTVSTVVSRVANLKKARVTQVAAMMSEVNSRIRGLQGKSSPLTLETALTLWGVTDPSVKQEVRWTLGRTAERLMVELMAEEERLTETERGGVGCQTDVVGMDFLLTRINDVITPVLIGMKNHDCLRDFTVMEVTHGQRLGFASSAFMQVMLFRSQLEVMRGKVVVVVGPGGYSRRKLWTAARDYGIQTVIVEDSDPNHVAKDSTFRFLYIDSTDHSRDEEHAETIANSVREDLRGLRVHGCMTVYEDNVPLCALVGERLGLKHLPGPQAARTVKSKLRTHNALFGAAETTFYRPPTRRYACPTYSVRNLEDLLQAVNEVPMPAFMKMEYGNSAVGARVVHNLQEAQEHLEDVRKSLIHEEDRPGLGLCHGTGLILTEFLQGTEHDVDVVLFQGQLLAAFLSDNGPTRQPSCMETVALMPSCLPPESQQQLIKAAAYCCRELGLHTGVYNVEMMMTARGPRLIEINGRMGGFYLREWILELFGVDLLLCALMCACGVSPAAVSPSSLDLSRGQNQAQDTMVCPWWLMGLQLYVAIPSHWEALNGPAQPHRLEALHEQRQVFFKFFAKEVEPPQFPDEEATGNVAVYGRSVEEAKGRLVALCRSLGLHHTELELMPFLQDFIQNS